MSEKKKKSATEANEAAPKKAKKSAKKKSAKKSTKGTNPADVRQRVSTMVKSKAMAMTKSVIGETQTGVTKDLQLATVKYLFEVAAIYPPQADQDAATADEDCLAKTLLNRLNIPDEPIRREEEEKEEEEEEEEQEEEEQAPVEKVSAEPAQAEPEVKDTGVTESDAESAKG